MNELSIIKRKNMNQLEREAEGLKIGLLLRQAREEKHLPAKLS